MNGDRQLYTDSFRKHKALSIRNTLESYIASPITGPGPSEHAKMVSRVCPSKGSCYVSLQQPVLQTVKVSSTLR